MEGFSNQFINGLNHLLIGVHALLSGPNVGQEVGSRKALSRSGGDRWEAHLYRPVTRLHPHRYLLTLRPWREAEAVRQREGECTEERHRECPQTTTGGKGQSQKQGT